MTAHDEQTEAVPDAVTKVARDLREIEDLSTHLEAQAIHKANAREMPGGDVMVALGPVANLEAWGHVFETEERLWWEDDNRDLDDRPERDDEPEFEPPMQTLLFWSEQLRRERGDEYGQRPTVSSEVGYLRFMLNWLWENEPHWADFADDVRKARRRLEDMLYDGIRVERGVPCMYDECKGARITRKILDDGRRTDWRCRKCKRTWDEDRYAAMVTAANEATKVERVAGETWCSEEYAAREVDRPVKTIRTWVNDGKVDVLCIVAGRRKRFVNLDQVRDEDTRAGRRVRKSA